jgi:hypothetical protein
LVKRLCNTNSKFKIQNSKLEKSDFKRLSEFGSVVEFWRINVTKEMKDEVYEEGKEDMSQ